MFGGFKFDSIDDELSWMDVWRRIAFTHSNLIKLVKHCGSVYWVENKNRKLWHDVV